MKKVMFYINAINGGGAERVMVNLANYFSATGIEVVFVTSYAAEGEYELYEGVKRLNLEDRLTNDTRLKRNIRRILRLREICKLEKPEVLISFMAEPNFRAILATISLPVKTIISVRNDPNKEYTGKIGKFVGKCLLPFADGCVFQTKEAQAWFPKRLQKKSTVIFNPVKEEFFHIERKPIKGEIVTCGRLEKQKNHKLLIDAFAEVVKVYPYTRLKIYGEGSLRESLQEQIDRLGLQGKAFLMGSTNDVGKALQTADLFVLSSDYEGMPNALMEAMAAGVPCISTDCPCGGPRELLTQIAQHCLVEVNNTNETKNTILNFINNNNKKDLLSKKEREISKSFLLKKVNEDWINFLNNGTKRRKKWLI